LILFIIYFITMLDELPDDIILNITKKLDLEDIDSLSQVSKRYYNLFVKDKDYIFELQGFTYKEYKKVLDTVQNFKCKCKCYKYGFGCYLCYIEWFKNNKLQTNKICTIVIQQYGYFLQYVNNQTEEICKLAVQQYGYFLQYVNNQTEDICKLAVQRNGCSLQYVHNQTEEICKLAVQENEYALYHVHNQTEEICRLAVQQDGFALYYVHNQTEEICKLAIQRDQNAINYIKDFIMKERISNKN